jgi:hypothetical protein
MDSFFAVTGLILTSVSAIWLLAHEIRERDQRGDKIQKRDELIVHREAMRRRFDEVKRNLERANASLDPNGAHQRYDVERMTQDVRRDLEEAANSVAEAEAALEGTPTDVWPKPVHFGAFALLLVGFLCQLVAELVFRSRSHVNDQRHAGGPS